jgi:two-component system C4-dicarboxylate transport sensor histidine kinase DctB
MTALAPDKAPFLQQYRALILLLTGVLTIAPLIIYRTSIYTRDAVFEQIRQSSSHTLSLIVANLGGELARFQALPHLLAADPSYQQLFKPERTPADLQRINELLEKNKYITGALELYVTDTTGLTLAASNWQDKRTFIGHNFTYRPYFHQAMNGSLGRFFAVGTTSKQRGYYFSYPIRHNREIAGVMVCKLKVGHFETDWRSHQQEIIVTDRHGIVFLSSHPKWLFRSLRPLSASDLQQIRAERRYDGTTIKPLAIKSRASLDPRSQLIKLATPTQGNQQRQGPRETQYMMLSHDMLAAGWKVHILASTKSVQTQVWQNGFAVSILLFSLLVGGALLLERLRRGRERIEIQRIARQELEQRVKERTEKLERAQNDLVQAGKLAVLGKMSAGLSHELNQPLAAIRSYSDNAATFLARGQLDPARQNLTNIGELTDRMARIIKNLRTYARKDKVETGPTDLTTAVNEALSLLNHQIEKAGVTVDNQLPKQPVIVHGGLVRLQQVFVNILSNALDAMKNQQDKQIGLALTETEKAVTVRVKDNGPGIKNKDLERVFDPFYSTKDVGKGLGLGLSISYGIIEQFKGHIEIRNGESGGAVVEVTLPKEQAIGR